jgi:hypothetical protein
MEAAMSRGESKRSTGAPEAPEPSGPGVGGKVARGTAKVAWRGARGTARLAGKGTYRGGKAAVSAGVKAGKRRRVRRNEQEASNDG